MFKIPQKEMIKIVLIGCGGTGGFLAQNISRIIFDLKIKHQIILVDGDIVENKNIGRQLFYPFEIGKFKAQTLVERYSLAYGLNMEYLNCYLKDSNDDELLSHLFSADFIISAVDNALARKYISEILKNFENYSGINLNKKGLNIWIDTGNGNSDGQILIGNSFNKTIIKAQNKDKINFIPYPSLMEPNLINSKKEKNNQLGCADLIERKEQSTTINNFIASITTSIICNLLEGKGINSCKIFANESIPIVTSVPISETIKKLK